jgi:hypothetical protein
MEAKIMSFLKTAICTAIFTVATTANSAGWKNTYTNTFTTVNDVTGWEFTLPWNPANTTTDYSVENGYLEIKMLSTDKGGNVLSPSFIIDGALKITITHYMHQAGSNPYHGQVVLLDESATPSSQKLSNLISLAFINSYYAPDYACSAYNLPRVSDVNGCVPNTFQSTITSSSLYDKWITTIITYNPQTGKITIDYDNDKKIDFIGTITKPGRFVPTRIAFGGFGWYTGHFHRIDSVKIESVN